jgi:hypothetical protein
LKLPAAAAGEKRKEAGGRSSRQVHKAHYAVCSCLLPLLLRS